MAVKELARFFLEYLPAHPEVRASLEAVADQQSFAKAVVNAGADTGFTFSEDDVRAIMDSAPRSGSGELSDAELGRVAGGGAGAREVQFFTVKLINARLY
jgi:predicted ribosomally synthesized peptide with nif11-like leader